MCWWKIIVNTIIFIQTIIVLYEIICGTICIPFVRQGQIKTCDVYIVLLYKLVISVADNTPLYMYNSFILHINESG